MQVIEGQHDSSSEMLMLRSDFGDLMDTSESKRSLTAGSSGRCVVGVESGSRVARMENRKTISFQTVSMTMTLMVGRKFECSNLSPNQLIRIQSK